MPEGVGYGPGAIQNMLRQRLANNPSYQQAMGQPQRSPQQPVSFGSVPGAQQGGGQNDLYRGVANRKLFDQWLPGGQAQRDMQMQNALNQYGVNGQIVTRGDRSLGDGPGGGIMPRAQANKNFRPFRAGFAGQGQANMGNFDGALGQQQGFSGRDPSGSGISGPRFGNFRQPRSF